MKRTAPSSGRAGPMTAAEMRQMRADGEPVSAVMQRAYVRNGLSRSAVRAILSGGEPDAA